MGDRLDYLFQEWHRLGGAVLLAEVVPTSPARAPEAVIAESTAHCRDSGRLTWVVLDWLIRHVEQLNEDQLLKETKERGNLSVLGVLCDAAHLQNPNPKFERIARVCTRHNALEPFFHRVAKSPLAVRLTQENALEVFLRWNYTIWTSVRDSLSANLRICESANLRPFAHSPIRSFAHSDLTP